MNQQERLLAIMDVLDLTHGDWEAWLGTQSDASIATLDPDVEQACAQMIASLRNPQRPNGQQLYLQALATLTDDNLAKIVAMVKP